MYEGLSETKSNRVTFELVYITYRAAECSNVKFLNGGVILSSFCMRHHFHEGRSIVLPKKCKA